MDDEDLVQQVLGMFLDNMPQRIKELQIALDADDAQAARMAAHAIKGMAGNAGAMAVCALAGEMEDAAQAEDLEAVRARIGELADRFEELRKVLG
jgi:HPt (histidine-containing phosphotransfer) domain-containing protein